MDVKKMYLVMLAIFVLIGGYYLFLMRFVYKNHPEWRFDAAPATTSASDDSTISSIGPAGQPTSASSSTTPSIGPTSAPSGLKAVGTGRPGLPVMIGSAQTDDPDIALALAVEPRGAGLNAVTINSYKGLDAKSAYVFQQPYPQRDDSRSMLVHDITIDGQNVDLSDVTWSEESASKLTATYGVNVVAGDNSPLVHLTARYEVQERGPTKTRENGQAGYEVKVTYHVADLSHRLHNIQLDLGGTTMPPREMERSDDRQIVAGYDKGEGAVDVVRDTLNEFKPGANEKDLSVDKTYKFLWAGESSVYFSAIVQPDVAGIIEKVKALCPDPDDAAEDRVVELDFQTTSLALTAGSSLDVPLKVFFGPKERSLLEGDYYGSFPRDYNQLLSGSSSFCGICALPWLVDRLVDLLQIFHWVLRDWGLAIIALVVLVRLALHPISKHSQVSMLKMQKMGPELERLKKKFGDDKEGYSKAQMEFTKEMGIMPFLGCLPMFLQMPIWIALYSALQNEIQLRQAPFLWGLTWIHDLARPDRAISWDSHPFTVPFIGMKIVSLNILPLIVAAVMLIQQKVQPQPPAMTPEQEQQKKMMQWMSLLFSLFFYWMPSGLNLYILTSSTIAIFESKRIREHIKQKEEQEKGNRVIVNAKPTRQGKQNLKQEKTSREPAKPGGLAGWWMKTQEKVEQLRKEAERKNKKK